ncbi:MAG: hypothetical protein ABFS35_14380 [Bacteroidota bacterium]
MYFVAWVRPVMPFIEYEINKKYIAEVLCENKDKPEMKGNGKCHLKKPFKKANNEPVEQSAPAPIFSRVEELTTLLFEKKLQCLNPIPINNTLVPYIENYQFIFNRKIFHPPKFII